MNIPRALCYMLYKCGLCACVHACLHVYVHMCMCVAFLSYVVHVLCCIVDYSLQFEDPTSNVSPHVSTHAVSTWTCSCMHVHADSSSSLLPLSSNVGQL